MKPLKYIVLIACTVLCVQVLVAQHQVLRQKDLRKLACNLSGEFDNNDQADTDKSFYHVVLRLKPIWKDKTDGYWFYLEQAVGSSQHLPFRQQVWHIYLLDDTTLARDAYELKDPQQYVGAWQRDGISNEISLDSLVDRKGCRICLHKGDNGVYEGSTPGKECPSSLRSAVYSTSSLTISPRRIISWDRGWNQDDQQVWGAEEGGYVFIKRKRFY